MGDQNRDVKRAAVRVEKRTESSRCSGVNSAALGVLEMGHANQVVSTGLCQRLDGRNI